MRKSILLLIILIIASSLSALEIIPGNEYSNDFVITKYPGSMEIKANRISLIEENGYWRFESPDMQFTNTTGSPQLPAVRIFTDGNTRDYSVIVIDSLVYPLKGSEKIYPVQSPVMKGQAAQFTVNSEVYSSDRFLPENKIEIINPGTIMGEPKTLVEYYPVKYNPAQNTLIIYTDARIDYDYSQTFDYDDLYSPMSVYLIVTPSRFAGHLGDLIDLKKRQGFMVKVMETDTVGSTNTEIKQAIQDFYDSNAFGLEFVLLIGDTDEIPHFVGTETDNPPTDLYYSTLDGGDYFPDVYIGRMSVSDTTQLKGVIEKNITVQQADWSVSDTWAQRAYLMATDDGSFHELAEATQNYAAQRLRSIGMDVDSLYEYYSSGTPVAEAINNGRTVAIYTGHGSETTWQGPSFSQSGINALTNEQMYPLVFSYACLTGNYAYASESFGETWLRADNGAAGFVGSSVFSYWYEDDIMERSLIDGYTDSSYTFTGSMLNFSKHMVYAAYSGEGLSKRYFEMYNILGDPSFDLKSRVEGNLSIVSDSVLPSDIDSIRANVFLNSNYHDAYTALMFGDSLIAGARTQYNGYIAFENTFSQGDTLMIYASEHNCRMDSQQIILGDIAFAPEITRIIFDDSIFNFGGSDSLFSAGDSGRIHLRVANFGNDTIRGLTSVIKSGSPYLSLSDTLIDIPDTILPGSAVITDGFIEAALSGNAHFDSTIVFTSLIYNGEGDSVSRELYSEVFAPQSKYSGFVKHGAKGDTVLVTLSLKNNGDMNDYGIIYTVETDESLLTIISPTDTVDLLYQDSTVVSDTIMFIPDSSITDYSRKGFSLVLTNALGRRDTFTDSISFNKKDYLVLDYDGNNSSGPVIDSLLIELGYSGDYATSVSAGDLSQYNNVFLTRGVYPNNTFIESGNSIASALDSLLTAGEINMYMEGGECWYYDVVSLGGYSFNSLFSIDPVDDGSISFSGSFSGVNGSLMNGITNSYSGENSYLDRISVLDTTGQLIFLNNSDGYGIANETPDYRTVGLSFELPGLDDSAYPSTRKNMVYRIMEFFAGRNGIELTGRDNETKFAYISSSPSVFMNNYSIRFSAPQGSSINIIIYDVNGRLIDGKTLTVNSSGNHHYQWNASGNNVSSGVYFLQMSNEKGEMIRRKLIRIR
ncbi:MAG: C25 family cysteine peptidase [candidate division WOR-3 bacterium]|nr:C25 family cysteine peptidase [candidate division WOR-3 bacterium]